MKINLIGIWTIICREAYRTIKRVMLEAFIGPWISAILYILVFGHIIGSKVTFFDGTVNYIEFVFPGILTFNIMVSAFSTASALFYQRFMSHIEESLISPLSTFDLVVGNGLSSLFRCSVLSIGTYIIAIAFGIAGISHITELFIYFFLIAILFALLGLIAGLWAKTWEQVYLFDIFIVTPLSFLGGMFTSMDMIAPKFQPIVRLNPIFYFIDGIRYSMINIQESTATARFTVVSVLIVIVAIIVSILFNRGYRIKS